MTHEIFKSNNDDESLLSLPIKKKDLGIFISNLLGQQQSIEREVEAYFDIDHEWLVNLHNSLSQRIHMQAAASLVQFTSIIYFKGGLKRKFTTVDAFESYQENKKQLPIGIKIIWNYLIKFPNQDIPDKQQITFSAKIYSYDDSKNNSRSIIQYQIDHTERTWGDDIETLISSKVDDVIRSEHNLKEVYDFFRYILVIAITIFSLNYLLIKTSVSKINKIKDKIIDYQDMFQNKVSTTELINNKIDYLVDIVWNSEKVTSTSIWPVLMFFVLAFMFLFIAVIFLELTKKKFIPFLFCQKYPRNIGKEH